MRLSARPPAAGAGAPRVPLAPGLHPLGLRPRRDAVVHVPAGYTPERPAPLVLALHGAGSDAASGLAPLLPLADAAGLVLLAPASLGSTWDLLFAPDGPDVAVLDAALGHVLERVAVDPARLAVGGFSDGASAALALGLANGDLFTHVVAFSPGFVPDHGAVGRPPVFVSHGVADRVLPIDRCSRRLVPVLRALGHDVDFREFPGGHTVPEGCARAALTWLGAPAAPPR